MQELNITKPTLSKPEVNTPSESPSLDIEAECIEPETLNVLVEPPIIQNVPQDTAINLDMQEEEVLIHLEAEYIGLTQKNFMVEPQMIQNVSKYTSINPHKQEDQVRIEIDELQQVVSKVVPVVETSPQMIEQKQRERNKNIVNGHADSKEKVNAENKERTCLFGIWSSKRGVIWNLFRLVVVILVIPFLILALVWKMITSISSKLNCSHYCEECCPACSQSLSDSLPDCCAKLLSTGCGLCGE